MNCKRTGSTAVTFIHAAARVIADNTSYPWAKEVRMPVAIIIGALVLFCTLTALIGWAVAAYTHWLVVQPRRVKKPHAKAVQRRGEW